LRVSERSNHAANGLITSRHQAAGREKAYEPVSALVVIADAVSALQVASVRIKVTDCGHLTTLGRKSDKQFAPTLLDDGKLVWILASRKYASQRYSRTAAPAVGSKLRHGK